MGGEPFDQASACVELAERAQAKGLGVITFTGYVVEYLRTRPEDSVRDLLRATDLLVDGPYSAEDPETMRALVGSGNQRFIHLTPRYADYKPEHSRNRVDIRISSEGSVEMAGFLTSADLDDLTTPIRLRRTRRRASRGSRTDKR